MIKNNMNKEVVKNKYGFFELAEKPSEAFLEKYYAEKYYQTSTGTYQQNYSITEIEYFKNKVKRAFSVVENHLNEGKRFLDIGCGEGWAMQYFHEQAWEVLGIDYSSFGIEHQNPYMLNYFRQGNIYNLLSQLETQKYNVIWLSNVLEHVIDPELLLSQIKKVLATKGLVIITVPNDFSVLHNKLLEKNCINTPFWVAPPDHISYFNKDGLEKLCLSVGLKKEVDMADFPIDFNLFNPDTDYIKDKSKGRNVHLSRIAIENLLDEISTQKTIELYRILAEMGLGREIISFFTI
jgi:2-polyprenyl-3-methyl-5-hydroxy-6-metoxy-1,4-benzoquinol methylase